ncbi:MAG: hypothetical protein CVV52_07915 [Spirochaetae bacterium HGW-Spirochaetae-8]|jgi:uncharacterized protein YbjQ (UPF0145 family)|nr:MAG: hypothetical protein CVV52_07915 [Spirochaetae bacterium HGW-Spirochaetae-8]
MIFTTTGSIEGYQISEYLGLVSQSIVIGTNIFSDWLASIADIVGGQSKTYQKQLDHLYEIVIEDLKKKAILIGARAIVGLKVDFDELSGGNKSMFMMNAIGTAVKIKRILTETPEPETTRAVLDVDDFNQRFHTIRIKEMISLEEMLGDEDIQYIIRNRIKGCEDFFLKALTRNVYGLDSDNWQRLFHEYLESFPDEEKTKIIYSNIPLYPSLWDLFLSILKEYNLVDIEYVMNCIQYGSHSEKQSAFNILMIPKKSFNKNDITVYKDVIRQIQHFIPYNYEQSEKISGDRWICSCDKKNYYPDVYCNRCGKDLYGFNSKEINPKEIIDSLELTISIIESYFQ